MYQNILVALDGSPTSSQALQEALKIAYLGAKIIAISVVENPLIGYSEPVMAYDFAIMHDAFLQHSKNILEQARHDVQSHDNIQIETHVIDLNPHASYDIPSAILDAAQTYHADLIVMGTHGRQGIKRFFIGSIAEQLIRQSHLPVLLIREQPSH